MDIERLEKEAEIAAVRLQTERLAYRKAKMLLKQAKIAAGDDAVSKFIAEVREKVDYMRSQTVRDVLNALCDTLDGKDCATLINLDDKYYKNK